MIKKGVTHKKAAMNDIIVEKQVSIWVYTLYIASINSQWFTHYSMYMYMYMYDIETDIAEV